ncbi:MAG: ribonuclease III, partial [Treponema sp.]|nr:ribonuclease III [Treponema sp.]
MNSPALWGERKRELRLFCKSAELRFKSLTLLNLSVTHRSIVNEFSPVKYIDQAGRSGKDWANNERLEFLGDAVLGMMSASLLYRRFPEKSEGDLAKIKSVIVSEDILSGIAMELGLDRILILGKGEEQTGGRNKKTILADALEALIGALFLDSGYKTAEDFVVPRINLEIDKVLEKRISLDHKSELQELCQKLFKTYPEYKMVKRTGPEHERLFWMEVTINGTSYCPCTGKNKKDAEQDADRLSLESLNPNNQQTLPA